MDIDLEMNANLYIYIQLIQLIAKLPHPGLF